MKSRSFVRRLSTYASGILLAVAAGVVAAATPAQADHLSSVSWGSGSWIIAIDYEHRDWGGPAASRLHSNPGCNSSVGSSDAQGTLGQSNWNNDISSFRTRDLDQSSNYFECLARHWNNANYSGTDHWWSHSVPGMGSFNDDTSSIQWT